jgi:hypothetical protein
MRGFNPKIDPITSMKEPRVGTGCKTPSISLVRTLTCGLMVARFIHERKAEVTGRRSKRSNLKRTIICWSCE